MGTNSVSGLTTGETTVKRAFKYRFCPTPEQADLLNRTFGCVRYVYNRALNVRTQSWLNEGKRVSLAETDKMLTAWKRDPETAWLTEPSKGPLQAALRDLNSAYVNFWGKRARPPRFKAKHKSRESATFYTRGGGGSYRNGEIKLAKMAEPLDIHWHRPLPSGASPSSVTVSRDRAGRWFISILCDDTVRPLETCSASVGLDAGITTLATLSTGEKIDNPKYRKRDRVRVARANRSLSRKKPGSANRRKAKLKLARAHGRIADRRQDHLHKLSTRLINENQVICIEDLKVSGLMRNHCLADPIGDAGWRELRRQLEYKAAWYGRTVVVIDRWYPSSKTCSACGVIVEKLPLNIRNWTCRCGAHHDRDVNAAKNILAAGLAVTACGDGVRPARTSVRGGHPSMKQEPCESNGTGHHPAGQGAGEK